MFAAGMLGDAAIYAAVMISIIGILVGWHPDGEQETEVWTAWTMTKPFGRVLVGIFAVQVLARLRARARGSCSLLTRIPDGNLEGQRRPQTRRR